MTFVELIPTIFIRASDVAPSVSNVGRGQRFDCVGFSPDFNLISFINFTASATTPTLMFLDSILWLEQFEIVFPSGVTSVTIKGANGAVAYVATFATSSLAFTANASSIADFVVEATLRTIKFRRRYDNSFKTPLSLLKDDTTTLLQHTTTLLQDTSTLKEDTSTLKEDTVALKEDTSSLKGDTSTLKEDTTIIKGDTTKIKALGFTTQSELTAVGLMGAYPAGQKVMYRDYTANPKMDATAVYSVETAVYLRDMDYSGNLIYRLMYTVKDVLDGSVHAVFAEMVETELNHKGGI